MMLAVGAEEAMGAVLHDAEAKYAVRAMAV